MEILIRQGRSQGGVPQVHVHPPFQKSNKQKTNNLLCRIIRFYTNNPKCQYVYLSFYLNDYQIIEEWNWKYHISDRKWHSILKKNLHLVKKKYNMNKQNFDLTFTSDPLPNNFAPPISNSWLRPCTVWPSTTNKLRWHISHLVWFWSATDVEPGSSFHFRFIIL